MKTYNAYILIAVFVAGISVMALEILGTRVIGPYYGVSIYVWSALIAVTLGFLALGYYFGGLLADRKPNVTVLNHAIFLAGMLVLSIPLVSRPVIGICHTLGLRAGALASSLILFSPSMFVFGTIVPFSGKLTSKNLSTVGITTGRIYAVSTLGGLLGTLLTGFFLIPSFRLSSIFLIMSVVLFSISFVGYLLHKKFAIAAFTIAIAITVMLGFLFVRKSSEKGDTNAVYQTQSVYGELKATEDDMTRFLLIDGMVHTALPKDGKVLGNNDYLLSESFYPVLLPLCRPEGKDALLIGLGGGLIWKVLSIRGINVKSVEIDPKVVDIATEFFGFRGDIDIGDGRYYVQSTNFKYDFVIIDAYSSDEIPFHLFARECFVSISDILNPGGVLCINYIGFPDATVTISLFRTLKSVFSYVDVYCTELHKSVQSMFFFASREPLLFEKISVLDEEKKFRLFQKQRVRYTGTEGILITDEYNPVDLWWGDASLAWRRKTMEILNTF